MTSGRLRDIGWVGRDVGNLWHPAIRGALRAVVLAGLCAVTVGITSTASAQTAKKPHVVLQRLGCLGAERGRSYSEATDVSADGSVVVGVSSSPKGAREAFRWTEEGGMKGLGSLPGSEFGSLALGVSADGRTVVGSSGHLLDRSFRWTPEMGMEDLQLPEGTRGYGNRVSMDGAVVAGAADYGTELFRWTLKGGMKKLGYPPGARGTQLAVSDVSSDGSVVVGLMGTRGSGEKGIQAFRWTQRTGMKGLGDLPGGAFYSEAAGVSADGTVVVGTSHSARGTEAFYWTVTEGMKGLGDLNKDSYDSKALILSADGTVVIGLGTSDREKVYFIWDATNGMRDLEKVLVNDYGVDTDEWKRPWEPAAGFHIIAMSADRKTLVGYGEGPQGREAWRLTLPRALGGKQD